ncbi:hypothetical protein BDZ94DRAFT_1156642 [Collybia nuda]|uniref:Uncharacterized protein n=1 Tax=Collybia nuda TaxID=64659 RepID=A0A9P5YDZ7_9AGAR|nr:hypothetical protein BDZ94DRAFT_1156642 [Collybia nuda]
MSSKAQLDDPRNASLETKEILPYNWYRESMAGAASGMFLAGLIIVTRNRYLAWPSLALGVNGVANSHPLRAKEGGGGAWSSMLLCITALVATYVPLFIISK